MPQWARAFASQGLGSNPSRDRPKTRSEVFVEEGGGGCKFTINCVSIYINNS